jgi:hypothetical protein
MKVGTAVLAALPCWALFLVVTPEVSDGDRGLGLSVSIGIFTALGIVHAVIRASSGQQKASVLAHPVPSTELPSFELQTGLIVDDQLRDLGVGDASTEDAPEAIASAQVVQQIYQSLDD